MVQKQGRKWIALAIVLCLGLWGSAVVASEMSLGDLGKPEDYDQTMSTWAGSVRGFADMAASLPKSFNWGAVGKVTPAKDQMACGGCWSFASCGAVESKILIMGGPALDLSEQHQISCNTAMKGCCGGDMSAVRFWEEKGPMGESCSGYGDKNTDCRTSGQSKVPCKGIEQCKLFSYQITNYHTVEVSNIEEIKTSVYIDGPAYFRFDVYEDFESFWRNGALGAAYTHKQGHKLGGHAVLVLGWDDNKSAWLCKNSWGRQAGPNGDGTFWIAYSGHVTDLRFGVANFRVKKTGEFGSVFKTLGRGTFSLVGGNNWTARIPNDATVYNFVEIARTDDYVELDCVSKNHNNVRIFRDQVWYRQPKDDQHPQELICRLFPDSKGQWH
jgi:hypothetical protein